MSTHQAPERNFTVTVFGSSRVRAGDPEYQDALRLGRLLAERGWTLCNGGHDGTMEAAARGAKELGGRTIGVSFALYRPKQTNTWLDQEIVAETLFSRLEQLITRGDAYVVLRGGIGTLLELCLVWNLILSPEFAHKPVIAVGTSWSRVMESLQAELPMHDWEARALDFVPTVEAAIARLEQHVSSSRRPDAAAS